MGEAVACKQVTGAIEDNFSGPWPLATGPSFMAGRSRCRPRGGSGKCGECLATSR
jgi:hypothetical protein